MSERLHICYHGTKEENVESIRREGFRPGTYFAKHLEDAIGYGGPVVFDVVFPRAKDTRDLDDRWQFVKFDGWPADAIRRIRRFGIETLFENNALGEKVFESNINAREDL